MEFSKEKLKQIRWLMILAALLVLAIVYSSQVLTGIQFAFGIAKPFLYGGVIAFVLNIPMRALEEKALKRWNGKAASKVKRPLCMVLTLVGVVLVVALVGIIVIPQITVTAGELGRQFPKFTENVGKLLDRLSREYPELEQQFKRLKEVDINWETLIAKVWDFLRNGAGDVISNTFSFASGIISGVVNGTIAFIFALYLLAWKERLADQGKRVLSAFLPEKVSRKILQICTLLYKNFSSFITGQCLEAVILGIMFVIAMSLCGMPYALMVGVLIAFTALIPIVGAFIGCVVGAFLILIDNPVQAVWFIVLFLVLQQIEGNLIYPRVVGNSVGLPSIWVLMAVSLGGSLFGVAGMLFFIPLMSSCYYLFKESVNARNEKRGRTGQTAGNSGGGGTAGTPETYEPPARVSEKISNQQGSKGGKGRPRK